MRLTLRLLVVLAVLLLFSEACATSRNALPDVSGQTWDYVVLGSSIGTWWSEYYGEMIESDLGVELVYHDYYRGQQKISSLLQMVTENEQLREDIGNAEVITIGVGFADFVDAIVYDAVGGAYDPQKLDQAVEEFRDNFDAMLSEVVALASPTDTTIRIMDFYFPYVDVFGESEKGSEALQYWTRFNECIREAGDQHSIPVANVFEAFNGPQGNNDPAEQGYLIDARHSSEEGMKVIAEEFRKLGYERASK